MQKYQLEFILHTQNASVKTLKSSLSEFGEGLEVIELSPGQEIRGKNFKVNINTEEPTAIFDVCAQFGRIRQIKVNEEGGK